jgi:hypothetical protein
MRKIILFLMVFAFTSCVPPAYKYEPVKEDPLLESIRYYREQDCLRNCSDRELWEKKKCD